MFALFVNKSNQVDQWDEESLKQKTYLVQISMNQESSPVVDYVCFGLVKFGFSLNLG